MADEAMGGDSLLSPEPTTTSTWYGEANQSLVESKGWKTPDDALKSYSELEKSYSGRVKMCTPESSAEEIRAFYSKTGCPENPKAYDLNLPEGSELFLDDETIDAVCEAAWANGGSNQAVNATLKSVIETLSTRIQKTREQGEQALKEEFGDKYDENLTIAKRFCETCSDEFKELLEKTGLGNNPIFIKEFMEKGKQTMGDTLIKGSSDSGEKTEGYKPQYPNTPEMYASGEDEESVKARAYFTSRGHVY